jgi:hypothetical protein
MPRPSRLVLPFENLPAFESAMAEVGGEAQWYCSRPPGRRRYPTSRGTLVRGARDRAPRFQDQALH